VDLDNDGIPDILSGSWPGRLYFFKGVGKGRFAGKQAIKDSARKDIKIERASTVFAADWNDDGKLDLLIGDVRGHVHLILNDGSASNYAFGKPQMVKADGKPIQASGGDSHPIAVDWDSDGRVDLLLGCGDGSVLFYKNIGTAKEPKLAQSQTLVAAGKATGAKIAPGMRAKICAVDWNGDGRLDLLVGDFCMYQAKIDIPEKHRKAVEKARLQQKEIEKKLMDLRKKYLTPALQGPRKKETPVEAEVRKKKLRELADKFEDFEPSVQRELARLVKLARLTQPGPEEKKKIVAVSRELKAIEMKYAEIMEAMIPYESAPFDEPAEKSKARLEKMKAYNTQLFPLLIEAALLAEITRPYDSDQMAGSVWLYLRQEAATPKAQRRR
jgi:hypothetical protein